MFDTFEYAINSFREILYPINLATDKQSSKSTPLNEFKKIYKYFLNFKNLKIIKTIKYAIGQNA